jgi:ribose transport system permease protein
MKLTNNITGLRRLAQSNNLTTLSLVVSFLLLCLFFATQTSSFLSVSNLENLARTLAVVGITAVGMTMVLITGGVDISVGSVAALTGVLTSLFWRELGVPLLPSTLLAILGGTLVGLINGFVITTLKINPLITTLATFSIVRGLAFVLSEGQTNLLSNPAFNFIGRGDIFGIPFSLLLMTVLYLVFIYILNQTQFGRNLYAIGGSLERSRLAGIQVHRHLLLIYTLCSFFAALSGVIGVSQLGSSAPRAATGLEFTVITAVVLGGTSLSGGKGSLIGTLVGVVILRILDNGLVLMKVPSFYQDVARGLVLLLAVGFDQLRIRVTKLVGRSA